MPVTTCGQTTVLTGQDGMITMKPPGTTVCLLDKTDFPAPVAPATFSLIKVPANSDFRVNDPVVFTEKGTANLDASIITSKLGQALLLSALAPRSAEAASRLPAMVELAELTLLAPGTMSK
jgi:hypothetical protein